MYLRSQNLRWCKNSGWVSKFWDLIFSFQSLRRDITFSGRDSQGIGVNIRACQCTDNVAAEFWQELVDTNALITIEIHTDCLSAKIAFDKSTIFLKNIENILHRNFACKYNNLA